MICWQFEVFANYSINWNCKRNCIDVYRHSCGLGQAICWKIWSLYGDEIPVICATVLSAPLETHTHNFQSYTLQFDFRREQFHSAHTDIIGKLTWRQSLNRSPSNKINNKISQCAADTFSDFYTAHTGQQATSIACNVQYNGGGTPKPDRMSTKSTDSPLRPLYCLP